jgi:hypothetical protein
MVATPATAPRTAAVAFQRRPFSAESAASRAPVDMYVVFRIASANSAAVANRSAGSFSSAVSTAASTWRGIVWRWVPSERGLSVRTRATTACAVFPVKGGSPVSIS